MTLPVALTGVDRTPIFWRDHALAGALLMNARYRRHQFERHLHDEMVIVVTEEGSGEVETRFGTDRSAPGTVWVFAAGEYHCGQVQAGATWSYRAIYLDQAALDALAEVCGGPTAERLFVPPGLYQDPQLAYVIGQAHRLHAAGAPLMERQARWWAAMGMLFGRYGQPRLHRPAFGNERASMAIVRDFIAAHFRREISIDELSGLTGSSRYHLMRSFKGRVRTAAAQLCKSTAPDRSQALVASGPRCGRCRRRGRLLRPEPPDAQVQARVRSHARIFCIAWRVRSRHDVNDCQRRREL